MFHRPAETIRIEKNQDVRARIFRRRFETKPCQMALPIPKSASNAVQYKNCQRIKPDTLFQRIKLADAPLRAARKKATLVFTAERTPLRTAR